tara:strand:- start:49 stop:336 length:288 start_codon:yes stop_codon:yes gene_type:complete
MADLIITVTISETNQKCMLNDLLDINTWVQDAVEGKCSNCWTRFQRAWTDRLMADESFTDPIPSNKTDFINLVLARPDYKDRATRQAEADAERDG